MKNLIIILSILLISFSVLADTTTIPQAELQKIIDDAATEASKTTAISQALSSIIYEENGNLYIESGSYDKIFYNGKQIYSIENGCN